MLNSVNCCNYIAMVTAGWMNMKQRQNDTHRRKPEHSEKNLSQNHPAHHKSQTDWPGNTPRPPQRQTSNELPKTWHSLRPGGYSYYFWSLENVQVSSGCVKQNTVVITADIWAWTVLQEERRKVGEMNKLWKEKCYQLLWILLVCTVISFLQLAILSWIW